MAYAQRAGNWKKLLHLALYDVHESVRVAAVKNLPSDAARLEVIENAACDKSLRIALNMIDSDEARSAVAQITDLDEELKLRALEGIKSDCEDLLIKLAADDNETVALYAINRSNDSTSLESIYSEKLSDARCVAIIEKLSSASLIQEIFESSAVKARRLAALKKNFESLS